MRARVVSSLLVLLAAAGCAAGLSVRPEPAAASTRVFSVTSPSPYQVFQRGGDGLGGIVVRGVSRGLGGRVEASWGDDGLWTSGRVKRGAFTLVLSGRSAGQATLYVRPLGDPAHTRTVPCVGIGDVFVIAGQSNASGRGTWGNHSDDPVLHAGLFGNDDRWKELRDPVDSSLRQVDKVSVDRLAAGSVWPLVATGLMAAEPVPVAFVPCAKSTTSIFRWLRDPLLPFARTTLYGSMVRRARAAGGVRAVLFWQGEADARAEVPRERYAAALEQLGSEVRQDLEAPLVAAQIGDYDARYTAAGVNAIRLAQEDAWNRGSVLAGPVLYDVDLQGRVHFTQSWELQTAARRWTAAILAGVERRDVPRGPQLTAAAYDGWEQVELTFSAGDELRPSVVGGLTLQTADGQPVSIQYAAVTGADRVSLYLPTPFTEPLVVSLGDGREAAGQPVPVEASDWALPARPFVSVPVVLSADAPSRATAGLGVRTASGTPAWRWRALATLL
jgi:hypothetical protein